MSEKEKNRMLGGAELRIGLGLTLVLILAHLFPSIQPLSAGTAIIMCTQESGKVTWKSGLSRMEGVLIGGLVALLVVALDNAIGDPYLFALLCGVGVILNLLVCRLAKMPGIVAKVSCITFALVTLATQGEIRFRYALLRLFGTAVGALVALLIAWITERFFKKESV